MNIIRALRFAIVLGTAAVLVTGCSTPSKKHGANGGDTTMDGLPSDTLNATDAGIAANARPDGVNPETDVDYNQLAQYTIYFAFDSSTVQASERGKLQSIAQWLKDNPAKRLYLAGHADIRGTPEYNRGLGERRAQATREYLVGLGIDASRLFTISYGSDRPAVDENNEAAYAKNRRVAPGVITK